MAYTQLRKALALSWQQHMTNKELHDEMRKSLKNYNFFKGRDSHFCANAVDSFSFSCDKIY